MEYNILQEIIGQYGFPILACGALFVEMRRERKAHQEQIGQLQAAHKDEVKELSSVVQNNTNVLTQLVEVMKNAQNRT